MSDMKQNTATSHYRFDKSSYDASCAYYEKLVDNELCVSDTIILSGYDASMKVRGGSLVLTYKQAHKKGENETIVTTHVGFWKTLSPLQLSGRQAGVFQCVRV